MPHPFSGEPSTPAAPGASVPEPQANPLDAFPSERHPRTANPQNAPSRDEANEANTAKHRPAPPQQRGAEPVGRWRSVKALVEELENRANTSHSLYEDTVFMREAATYLRQTLTLTD